MKIIVYTGSFNPITNGHILTMKSAIDEVNADLGMFVMVHEKYLIRKMYLKNKTAFVLSDQIREQMINSVCETDEKLVYGGRQIGGSNPSTIKTLNSIRKKYKNAELYLLLGADKLRNFSKWDDALEIFDVAKILVASRKDFNIDEVFNNDLLLTEHKHNFTIITTPLEALYISSSEVRNRALSNMPYDDLMPLGAYNILKQVDLNKFKQLSFEDLIRFELSLNGRYGSRNACNLVYKSNFELFKNWDESLLGDKESKLKNTKVYKNKFITNYHFNYNTIFDCVNKDCADVAEALLKDGYHPAILNLASNISPGGGYHKGTNAQEECLCQMSTLSQSLYQFGSLKYKHIQDAALPNYTGVYPLDINYGGIYSPDVVFFRHNKSQYYAFRQQPFVTSIITVASLSNREKNNYTNDERKYFNNDGTMTQEGINIETNKIRTILRIALDNGHDSVVLGAFGCGVFNLLPSEVSKLFYDVLCEPEFKNNFKKVVFAILEGKGKKGFKTGKDGKFKPFYDLFKNN